MSQPFTDWLSRKPAGPKPRKPIPKVNAERKARRELCVLKHSFARVILGKKPLKRIRQRSPTKAADDRRYYCEKIIHFAEHPGCQYPGGCTRSILKGDVMDLHHAAGRNGPLLYCRKYMRTACRAHHDLAKTKISESRRIGWVIDVSSEEVRALRTEEILSK
jgi:hypothetical protein